MANNGACSILEGYITMLWPLSWDDDNWRSMVRTLATYNHALTVVMRRWQLTVHVSYMRDISPCSERCHETMTTDGVCFIPVEYITMLWPLSWDDGNRQSMIHTLGMNNYALTVVIIRWKLTEHVSCIRDILPCSDRCHETMTTDGACFMTEEYIAIPWPLSSDDGNWQSIFHTWGRITMLWPLSWDDDNWQSILHILVMNNHALSVVMRPWQLTEHVSNMNDILPWTNRCHETMTTDGA